MYERYGKRLLDIILSLAATIILAIPMGLVALWIKLDSPGPVFFKQRRVGKGKTHFNILKFRTMRGDTPHDVPTHLLKDADSYITGSGAFLRKTSLDELPQLINVVLGGMSLVGPRPIVSGEIGEDLTYFFANSEQIPTVCALGVLVSPDLTVAASGGYLLQLLPGADEETIERIEKNLPGLKPVSTMVHEGLSPLDMLQKALEGFELEVIEERQVEYRCDCSRERVERVLISLGTSELEKLAEEQEMTEVACHFCEKRYTFTSSEIKKLAR